MLLQLSRVIFSRDAVLSHLVLVETASEALAAVIPERNEGEGKGIF